MQEQLNARFNVLADPVAFKLLLQCSFDQVLAFTLEHCGSKIPISRCLRLHQCLPVPLVVELQMAGTNDVTMLITNKAFFRHALNLFWRFLLEGSAMLLRCV